jgi:hypothetical protein
MRAAKLGLNGQTGFFIQPARRDRTPGPEELTNSRTNAAILSSALSTAPGSGISRSTIRKSAPGLETCANFICAIFIGTTVALLVAINPLMNFKLLLKSIYYCFTGLRPTAGHICRTFLNSESGVISRETNPLREAPTLENHPGAPTPAFSLTSLN